MLTRLIDHLAAERRRRRATQLLASLSERQLDDIGVCRAPT